MASREGGEEPSMKAIGGVYKKVPVESVWQSITCRTDSSK